MFIEFLPSFATFICCQKKKATVPIKQNGDAFICSSVEQNNSSKRTNHLGTPVREQVISDKIEISQRKITSE